MRTAKQILLWFALALACFLPLSALTPTAPENRIREIFSIGYDVPVAEAITGYDSSVRPTSGYDEAPNHRADGEHRSALGTCALFGPNAEFKAAEGGGANLSNLQSTFENLADQHLLPQFQAIDPNLEAGYTGSFQTGVVGNPNKVTFGQPIDLSNFDIDYWIKSDTLYQQYGNSLKANVGFRQILSDTPGFEGLKPNKAGFSIKFLPSSP